MKSKITILWIVLLLLTVIPVFAQQYDSEDDFKISRVDGGKSVIITKYRGSKNEVHIPPKINNLPVIGIGREAFFACNSITSVTIPDGVTSIEGQAFACCNNLATVIIPDSVTSMGHSVFTLCIGLISVIIPDSVTRIGSYAFYRCIRLTRVIIPDSVKSMGYNAFYNCTNLNSVTFQGKVELKYLPVFDDGLDKKYLAEDGGPGIYKRIFEGAAWEKEKIADKMIIL